MTRMKRSLLPTLISLGCIAAFGAGTTLASSHREAPMITGMPKVDATDFYMFRSYEEGRSGFVTFLANYIPLQDPQCGPNCNMMDDGAVYTIQVDNNGDAIADRAFQFRFQNTLRDLRIDVGGMSIPAPLQNMGAISPADRSRLNTYERYTVTTENGRALNLTTGGGSQTFVKPFDNIGEKTFASYGRYASAHIADIGLPRCATPGRVFVGQRRESFFINLGEIFDLINTNPVGPRNAEANDLNGKNITTIALEVPIACLVNGTESVIGAWTTAKSGSTNVQFSRLGNPLVNEVVIGLKDKDKFNASSPHTDGQFAAYVTNPSFPEIIQALHGSVTAPNSFPRNDLVATFLTGISGLNQPAGVRASEMLRLNTTTAPADMAHQNNLGVIGGDLAGFPNGRRPGDDVVDIALRVMMGKLLSEQEAPSGQLPYTDGVSRTASDFYPVFPYLVHPIPGSPNDTP